MESSVAAPRVPEEGVLVQHRVSGFSNDWIIVEQPVPEAAWHDAALELLKAVLSHWIQETRKDAAIFRNLAIRVREDDPRVGFDPDLCLVNPAPPRAKTLSSLCLWQPGHSVPSLVVEVVSPRHPHKDYVQIPDQCAALGVRELIVFDPMLSGPKASGGAKRIQMWQRTGRGTFERTAAGDGPIASPLLGGYLVVTHDGIGLRIAADTEGTRLWPTEAEAERAAREAERAARETERAETERERTLKDRALLRVRELEAELRKRGD